jgi:gamma-glutamylcyclotransferase (GGCT)/AIG2-like uncharacterized protein YtfP
MKLYVAYGSNLNLEQMEQRCPDARVVGKGVIEDYALKYRGSKTGAYLTILREKGKRVPVAVWAISESDERSLDRYEGFPTFYYKKRMRVLLENGKTTYAMAYVMSDRAQPGIPSEYYVRTCFLGYVKNGLDLNIFYESLEDNERECKNV